MPLDKAIEHGKEKRRPYRGAKAVCASCRNHGGCPHCEGARKAKDERRKPVEDAMSEAHTFPKDDGTLALLRCPNDHENYSAAVMSGKCAFCGYDANAEKEEGHAE